MPSPKGAFSGQQTRLLNPTCTSWDISHPSPHHNAGWINLKSRSGQRGRWRRVEADSCNKVLCPSDNTIVTPSNESSKNAQRKWTLSTSTHLVPQADQIKSSQIKTPINCNPPFQCPCLEDLPWWASLFRIWVLWGPTKTSQSRWLPSNCTLSR